MRKEDSNPHRPVRVKIRQAVLPIQTIPHFYYALIAEGLHRIAQGFAPSVVLNNVL